MRTALKAPPIIIAHRGASLDAPENTLASIKQAARQGADFVELDVTLCVDGAPVIIHDATLDRTTDGSGKVCETRFDDLRALSAGAWFEAAYKSEKIPTLEEVILLGQALGLQLNLEIKPSSTETAARTAQRVVETAVPLYHGKSPPFLSSFSTESLEVVKRMVPKWPRGYLIEAALDSDIQNIISSLKPSFIGCAANHQTRDSVQKYRKMGCYVWSYTVNDVEYAKQLYAWGVTGFFTDTPERFNNIVW